MQFECCFSIIDLYIDIYGYAVVAPPGLKLCNPYFLISETNGRNASMNNSTIRVLNMKREITLFNLPQLRYTTSIKYMFSVLIVLLFYIVHCCIDIEDRSLSGLYFNRIILSYLILFYERMKVVYSPFAIQNDPYT
jgi:hypothetical protein